ncbi:MAG TPA: 30S ribosomal protein S18 [Candidatus Paceibacterota bacterium]|nr:30S ribosomal protein S18 [Candidatus Paceibacterota bacterium]HVX90208.1 30S ribosomal protein S18 [Candidatus Paceibacterota bacterium]
MAYQAEREEIEHKKYVDYKDVAYLKLFTDPHAKMLSKKRTGVSLDRQREIALAIKRARYMALLPYLTA